MRGLSSSLLPARGSLLGWLRHPRFASVLPGDSPAPPQPGEPSAEAQIQAGTLLFSLLPTVALRTQTTHAESPTPLPPGPHPSRPAERSPRQRPARRPARAARGRTPDRALVRTDGAIRRTVRLSAAARAEPGEPFAAGNAAGRSACGILGGGRATEGRVAAAADAPSGDQRAPGRREQRGGGAPAAGPGVWPRGLPHEPCALPARSAARCWSWGTDSTS